MFTFAFVLVLLPQLISAQCKLLELPWGRYPGTYNEKTKICTFSNVRFAGPPTGKFRFMAPQTPQPSDPEAPKDPVSCVQVDASKPCISGGESFYSPQCPNQHVGRSVEDCLFLDIYVPQSVLTGTKQVSVVVWFYGGAYIFGSKHQFDISKIPLYSGQGLLGATPDPLIFVVGNYRLGAFGWLAGSLMEKEALPNAGLYDQRKILEFVKDHITKVNGDPKKVSAWGESAGAGSIIHHLIAKNGGQNPLFSRAVLQSPAFEWQWNRTGSLNDTYTTFAGLAGCPTGDLQCLQSLSETKVSTANQELFETTTACLGVFPLGPSLDRDLIKTLPAVAFKTGQYWTGLTSIIISHVSDEVRYKGPFIPYPIRRDPTPANFDKFLTAFMPGNELAKVRDQINKRYPSEKYKDQLYRVGELIRDASFTCNTRQLFDAYKGKINTWMMNYHFLANFDAAVHASDLLPTFCNNDTPVSKLLQDCLHIPVGKANLIGPYMRKIFSPNYLSYLKSHAIHGNPNDGAKGLAKKTKWQPSTTRPDDNHDHVRDVMQPRYPDIFGNAFEIVDKDPNNTATSCGFWNDVAAEIMAVVGPHKPESLLTVQDAEKSSPELSLGYY